MRTLQHNLHNAREFFLVISIDLYKDPWKTILFQCPKTLQNQTKRMVNVIISLTLLSRMELPTFIKYTCPFSSSELLGVVLHSYLNFNRSSCKQTVESMIRHCSLWRLILACTIYSMSHKQKARLRWVNTFVAYVTYIYCIVSS